MIKEKLTKLYANTSKHSNYQLLPSCLEPYVSTNEISVNSRFELERLKYVLENIDVSGKSIVDIGGNTGFFGFELLEHGAKSVLHIEGNSEHAQFVDTAAKELNKPITVLNRYLTFTDSSELPAKSDVILTFNVLHHLGDDFGDKNLSMQAAKDHMKSAIAYFHDKTDLLVLQLGFCWKGDRNMLLFPGGTKAELIDFVKDAISNTFEIQCTGVADVVDGSTVYHHLNDKNIARRDDLGEFRNRPIFILKSIKQ